MPHGSVRQVNSPAPHPDPATAAPLALFEALAVEIRDPDELEQRVARNLPLKACLERQQAGGLLHRSGVFALESLRVSCSDHSPLQIDFDDCQFATLALPIAGSAQIRIDGHELVLNAEPMAAFLPGSAFRACTDQFSEVMITLDPRRLAETAAAIAGDQRDANDLRGRFESPSLLSGGSSASQAELLRSLWLALGLLDSPVIPAVGGAVHQHGLEDLLYRIMAAMLCPELIGQGVSPAITRTSPYRETVFNELLEWIRAHLHEPITLTLMSRRSAYSTRNLHYVFQRRFGCTPMQWVREQRLAAVHSALQRAEAEEQVSGIAARYGFQQMSSFSKNFQRRYGVTPSTVLRRSRLERESRPGLP
ncbi:helix-turn-helix transcriptional regulator [Synechococcus sp. J7-Johnson]|uniref:helix-turn-helix domain-containing protein n=1 Tax=Synechococcus sp. J7-Johnson TaxID=2823737 RepID=UPI0020CCBAEB|nr:helix-turn-helix transcriptional regulator [Synechococcus sp. J7-Johnson]MCP9842057.1 helix-turn-helix transcriptional regulator [Synechococcus sp. J7-Johnson]